MKNKILSLVALTAWKNLIFRPLICAYDCVSRIQKSLLDACKNDFRSSVLLYNITEIKNESFFLLRTSLSSFCQVEYALKYPLYSTVDALEHRGNIERFNVNGFQRPKSGYW